jgi:hypothetical protein
MKIGLNRLVFAVETKILAKVGDLIPPGGYLFRAAKFLNAVEREYGDYVKQRNALIVKYGVDGKDVNGRATKTLAGASPENIAAYSDAMSALLDVETTIPYEPIIFAKLGPEAQTKLSINDVRALGSLIVEDEAALTAAPVA